jgi:hypothetical protein
MKKLSTVLFFLLFSLVIRAQDINMQHQALMDDFLKERFLTEVKPIPFDITSEVFNGNFYRVSPGFRINEGTMTCFEFLLSVHGDVVSELEDLSTDMELSIIFSLVKDEFLLRGEADARLLEASLDVIYPMDTDDIQYKKHYQKDGLWYFIRGKFFDQLKAFVFTPDGDGKIIRVQYYLSLPEGQ